MRAVSLGLAVNPFPRFWPNVPLPAIWLIIGLLALSVVFVSALGGAFYSDHYNVLPKGKRLGATLGMVAAIGLVAFIVWSINAIATPLDYVKVCAKTRSHKGVLVASTSDTIYIGEYPSPQPSS